MARIAETEIERLKVEVSLLRLMEAAGMAFKKAGKDYACCCPFHADATASLIVTPAKNLFHCFGCNVAGGPIDWLMQFDKLSFRAAVERLRSELGLVETPPPSAPLTTSKFKAAPLPLAADADGQTALRQVLDYYHQTLKDSPEALDYLRQRGLQHPDLISRFRLGYANRTLGYRLPNKAWKEGQDVRGRLQTIGLLRGSGHEHFNGSLVVPVIDANGVVHEIYGRKIRDDLRTGTAYHLYLPGSHAGVWNEEGIMASGGEVILCEALFDAMTFWVHGFRNVTASYGANGFTDDHLAAFQRHQVKRVLIAYDRDDAGNAGADKLAAALLDAGIECFRVLFPKGMDANDYAQKVQPAAKSLGILLQQAEWLGKGKRPGVTTSVPLPSPPAAKEKITSPEPTVTQASPVAPLVPASSLAAIAAPAVPPALPPALPPLPAAPDAAEPPAKLSAGENTKGELLLTLGDRHWRIRGWQKNLSPEQMRVNVQVRRDANDKADTAYYVDTLDVYSAKQRAAYIKQAAVELGTQEDTIKRDLGRVLLKLEALQDAAITAALTPKDAAPKLSDSDEAAALELLKAPDLVARLVADMERCGVVGEATNLLAGYLAAVSRKLDAPLAVLIQSSSAAGKSSLMEAVLNMVPDEERIQYSAMTGQSLFYLGETDLQHKILAIAEEEGVRQAAYALKLLQSDGELTMASTGKDEATGNLVTKQYRVKGPVMLMLTTTAIDVDEELLNRCLVLTVNESREQTQAIHARQRAKQTLAGLMMDSDKHSTIILHQNAQRLLKAVHVVNPYANRLTFLDDKTRMRRDHMKYLTLIRAIALLHQHQRPLRSVEHRGQRLEYIEVTKDDIGLANRIAHEVLGRTLDELPPQTRRMLRLIYDMVRTLAERQGVMLREVRFTRRDVREATSWSDNQLKVHCTRLTEMEYLLTHGGSRGHHLQYELIYDGAADTAMHLCGLIDVAALDTVFDNDARKLVHEAGKFGPGLAKVGAELGSSWSAQTQPRQGVQADMAETGPAARIPEKNNSSLAAVVGAVVA